MNEFKLTMGIEFDNNYVDAKNKLIELVKALDKLTPEQNEHLAREFIASMGMAASLDQFIKYMRKRGKL